MSYTLAQVQQAINFGSEAYINGVFLGVLAEESVSLRIISNDTEFGSSRTGSNGAIGVVDGGTHTELELTLRNVNKNVLFNALTGYYTEVTSSTNIASPFTGSLEARANPRVKSPQALVLYPIWTDPATNTKYEANTSNPLAMVLPRAVYSGDFEFVTQPDEVTDTTLLFKGLVDPANNDRTHVWGSGIDTDGTIS